MSAALNELTDKALLLPSDERAILAQRLWESIEDFTDPDIEQAWLRTAEKRWAEIEKGEVKCIPADQVIKKAKARLRK